MGGARKWMGASLAGLGLSGLLGVCLGAGLFTFDYANGTSYMSNDPTACVNCHIMQEQYDGWQHAGHHHVANCNDCHVPHHPVLKYVAKADHGWRHSKAFTLQNFHEPIRITEADRAIVISNCVRCHQSLTDQMNTGLTAHGAEASDCLHCHARVGHGPRR